MTDLTDIILTTITFIAVVLFFMWIGPKPKKPASKWEITRKNSGTTA